MRWTQVTNTGLVRKINEDSLYILPQIGLLAVADGMGGHQAGEIASDMALQTLKRELPHQLRKGASPEKALIGSVKLANASIYKLSMQNQEFRGMGTTITACLMQVSKLFVAHVGDSRAYLVRDGDISQLTQDHSLVQELLRNGGINEEQALQHPQRNVLTRALGTDKSVQVDLNIIKIYPGDLLLLCTDGLTRYLNQGELLSVINNASDTNTAVRILLSKALKSGGEDNITIILAEI
ncbi:MAG: Stp1/IreP family PP2C-type Ser/Thr phosphatase [Desulfotomaculaceae bacterium]|nr:Stp1/IreP family PP2C-type Ser/Thr phosphatase [Desulfotomaculaceae bacterium]